MIACAVRRGTTGPTHLDGSEDDGGIGVLELGQDALDDLLGLLGIRRPVLGDRAEDRYSSPLGALAERDEQLAERRRVDDEDVVRLGRLVNLRQRRDRVGDDLVR